MKLNLNKAPMKIGLFVIILIFTIPDVRGQETELTFKKAPRWNKIKSHYRTGGDYVNDIKSTPFKFGFKRSYITHDSIDYHRLYLLSKARDVFQCIYFDGDTIFDLRYDVFSNKDLKGREPWMFAVLNENFRDTIQINEGFIYLYGTKYGDAIEGKIYMFKIIEETAFRFAHPEKFDWPYMHCSSHEPFQIHELWINKEYGIVYVKYNVGFDIHEIFFY